MNKALIGALGGGLILFFWGFLSWSVLNIHGNEMAYTDKQDQILECLAEAGLEDGSFYMPNVPKGTPQDEAQAAYNESIGKPWALVTYRNVNETNMTMNMIRGFVVNVLAAFFLCYILLGRDDLTMQRVVISSVMVGLISYFTTNYMSTIWFGVSTIGHLIDAIVQWLLVGAFLGWWLRR